MNGGMPRTDTLNPLMNPIRPPNSTAPRTPSPDRPAPVGQEHAGHHAAQDHARADREVDPAGDDDERRSQRQDPDHGRRHQDADEIARREEVRARDGEEHQDHEQADEGQQLLQRAPIRPRIAFLAGPSRGGVEVVVGVTVEVTSSPFLRR